MDFLCCGRYRGGRDCGFEIQRCTGVRLCHRSPFFPFWHCAQGMGTPAVGWRNQCACIRDDQPLRPAGLSDFPVQATSDFNHYMRGHAGMEGNSPTWYLGELWMGTGIAALLAVCEIGRARRHRVGDRAAVVVLGSFVIAYFLFICRFNVRNDRTLLPIVPCVLLLAAMLAIHLASPQSPLRRVSPVLRRTALVALGLALVVTPLRVTIEQEIRLTTIDSRATHANGSTRSCHGIPSSRLNRLLHSLIHRVPELCEPNA